jgi:hypothetical protein
LTKRPKLKNSSIPRSPGPATTEIVSKKKWSKWLKFSGAALLLTAFGMQMRQNQTLSKEAERIQAAEVDARSHIKALEYENLYYSLKANGIDNPDYLRFAAMNYRIGRASMMYTSPGDKSTIVSEIKELDRTVAAVHDLPSFQKFILADNMLTSETRQTDIAGLVDADHAASRFGMLYLMLYATGSVLALVGQAID